jgi:hypothetical protein
MGSRVINCERIDTVRLVAILLAVTLTGPSVASLVCDWSCAAEHRDTQQAAGGCHESGEPATTAVFAAGHECHELTASEASILTRTTLVDVIPVHVSAAEQSDPIADSAARGVSPPGALHTPLRVLIPLRI